jgi:hypothetical protein
MTYLLGSRCRIWHIQHPPDTYRRQDNDFRNIYVLRVDDVIEHLYDHEMSSISTQRETRMAHIAGQLNMLNAELVTLIAGAINDHSWSGHGIHTPAQWLTIQLGASSSHAKQLVEPPPTPPRFRSSSANSPPGASRSIKPM